jgi:hypothetical protein
MKKTSKPAKRTRSDDAMRPEYADVAAEFPTAAAVNKALREVIMARLKRRTA